MQQTMLDEIKAKFGDNARVGLMATSGTIATGIYSKKAEKMGMKMYTPDEDHQQSVMKAIYGPKGAKARYTTGECYDDLYRGAEYLVKTYDCNVLILGCTELPLIFHETDDFEVAERKLLSLTRLQRLLENACKLHKPPLRNAVCVNNPT